MGRCCCLFMTSVSALLVFWGSISAVHVFRTPDSQLHRAYPFMVFTLIAAGATIMIGLSILSFQLYDISKDIFTNINDITHGVCYTLFLLVVLEVLCIASVVVFFKYADRFPTMSTFGQATLSYMLAFSLNNLIILFFIYYCCCYLVFPLCFTRSTAHFFAIFTVVGFPLIILSVYSSTHNQYYDQFTKTLTLTSLISCWLLAISVLLALLAFYIIFKLDSYSNCNLILGGAFLSFINVCFPYLSVELLLQFIYTNSLIGSESQYASLFVLNKSYACLILVQVYYIFFYGPALVINTNIIIQYKLEYLGAYTAKHQLLFQTLSILIEQTLLLIVLNMRLWQAIPPDSQNMQESSIILGIMIFGSALIVFHLLSQFLLFRFSTPDDNLVKIMTISMVLEYLLLILLAVVMIMIDAFSIRTTQDELFQEKQIVFLVVVGFVLLFTYPRIMYTNLIIYPKSLQAGLIEIDREENEVIELTKINFDVVLELLSSEQIKGLENTECSICLSPFETVEENAEAAPIARIVSCGHAFHDLCIKGWLQFRGICPLDRKKVE